MRLKYSKAIQMALEDELTIDENVVLFGEDIETNLYGYTDGFVEKFGRDRIMNMPLSESAVVGLACGAAMCGLRPVVDLTVANFTYVAMDQIVSIAAKTCYMYNGTYKVPITILCSTMAGSGNAAQHSDRPHLMFSTVPGLKVICPATPQDVYSMLRGAIRDENPVLCFADRSIFWRDGDVDRKLVITPGHSKKVLAGADLTIITVSSCLQMLLDVMPEIEKKEIHPDIIDIRSVRPMDYSIIMDSVKNTGKVLILDTANRSGSIANEIASAVQAECFEYLEKPIQIIASEDYPVPFAKNLEDEVLINQDKIFDGIIRYMNGRI